MLQTIIDHFDAIVLFDNTNGNIVLTNDEFNSLFDNKVKNFKDLENIFFDYYKSNQVPILNTMKIDNSTYIVKRKIIGNSILYHFENNHYYMSVIDNIQKQAHTDELTGCYNKKEFENIFKRMLSSTQRYSASNFTVIMLDIDHFKNVNDTYGHLAGDYILRELSSLVRKKLRDSDIFSRVGGEEFIVLLPQTKLNGSLKTAQKVREFIEETKFIFNGETIPVTISLGTTSTMKNDTYFSILDRVDKALYEAKNNGRNKVEYL